MSVDATVLRKKITEVALANPDQRYAPVGGMCRYTEEDGSPGCLVGTALAELDAGLDYDNPWNEGSDVHDLAMGGYITGDPQDVDWAFKAQTHQDAMVTWGTAVALADTAYPDDEEGADE